MVEVRVKSDDDDDIEEALRGVLKTLHFPMRGRARAGLRLLVAQYVDELKRRDLPPERVIVQLKALAREAGIGQTENSHPELNAADSDKLVVEMVEWCIERYYVDAPA